MTVLLAAGSLAMAAGPPLYPTKSNAKPAEIAAIRVWTNKTFTLDGPLPFSLRLDGKPFDEVRRGWKASRTETRPDSERRRITFTWTSPEGGLQVSNSATLYTRYPVCEWVVEVRNTGSTLSSEISDLRGAETALPIAGPLLLHHFTGSPMGPSDYQPFEEPLTAGTRRAFGSRAGRPTDPVLPCFNLAEEASGWIVVVGWPGHWSAEFERGPESVRVRAGQQATRFRLEPGEAARSPLMVVLRYQGDWVRGQNVWRRWMIAHNLPRPSGALPPPQLNACSSHQYGEMIHANDANQKMFVDRYHRERIALDYWWMDAGWYPNTTGWPNTGTWEVDRQRFPNGLRSISDHARRLGMKTIVWFEPERVTPGTWLWENHPEWLLPDRPPNAQLRVLQILRTSEGPDPCATFNPGPETVSHVGITWQAGQLALHPGPRGEYAAVRWKAPTNGLYRIAANFEGIAGLPATTSLHLLAKGSTLFEGAINLGGQPNTAAAEREVQLQAGDEVLCAVGWGNGSHTHDTTALTLAVFGPNGAEWRLPGADGLKQPTEAGWEFGFLPAGPAPEPAGFQPFTTRAAAEESTQKLLNLGDKRARTWLTNHVEGLLRSEGIDLYRQDFNMDPLAHWRAADGEAAEGLAEMRHVLGYLVYWDALRARNPALLIDSCASGGRRNDLETLRRSVPLLRSDYILEPVGLQGQAYGISFWMPFHGTGVNSTDPYLFRSQMAPSITLCYDMRPEANPDFEAIRRLVAQWRAVAPYWFGDYYPLTPYSLSSEAWVAWQFDRPDLGGGVVQAFRRPDCAQESITVRLRGLDPRARYRLRDLDEASVRVLTGQELMQGLRISAPARPFAVVLHYERLRR